MSPRDEDLADGPDAPYRWNGDKPLEDRLKEHPNAVWDHGFDDDKVESVWFGV